MRLAARVVLPGTGWIAVTQLMDLVGLMMDLLGKRIIGLPLLRACCLGPCKLVQMKNGLEAQAKVFVDLLICHLKGGGQKMPIFDYFQY